MRLNISFFRSNVSRYLLLVAIVASTGFSLMTGCGKEKEIIVQKVTGPGPVSLIYPMKDSIIAQNNPTFSWHKMPGAVRYQLQVARISDFVLKTVNTITTDTTHTAVTPLVNSTFFWRVKAQNSDSVWSDWADADVWLFYKSDFINYFELKSQMHTWGAAQDCYARFNADPNSHDTLYIADDQACLTIVNVRDATHPFIMRNLGGINDDHAKGVYVPVNDTTPYAYVADMDGKIQVLSIRDTTLVNFDRQFGGSQNLEDLSVAMLSDTMEIFAVSSGSQCKLTCIQVIYDEFGMPQDLGVTQYELPTDGNGIYADSQYAYVANGSTGLKIFDIHDCRNGNAPIIGSALLAGQALSVDVKGDYAYVACDRLGLFVVNIADKTNPDTVAHVIITKRAKDVQVAGAYAYLADADGGLEVVDVAIPDSAHIVTSYPTPYAYGVFVDTTFTPNRIYICDRDNGLMIFESKLSQ
jgi:hypothetical protein